MKEVYLITSVLIVIITKLSESSAESEPRIINKSDSKRPAENQISPQTGDIVYEDESEYHSDTMDEEAIQEPYPQHIQHIPYSEPYSFGSLSKRYGHSIFGDDFALFLVLLTIAGFFGLIMYLLNLFVYILFN